LEKYPCYGGADKSTIVFSWKGIEAGIAAIKSEHTVVMCPADYYYLDMAQSPDPYDIGASWKGYSRLQDVYQYEPIPKGLLEELKLGKGRIIGVQATAWGENLHTKKAFDYLLFPRLAAIAESAWSMPHNKNYKRFINTLQTSYCNILKDLDIQYCDYL
jgi:hexosaminidase